MDNTYESAETIDTFTCGSATTAPPPPQYPFTESRIGMPRMPASNRGVVHRFGSNFGPAASPLTTRRALSRQPFGSTSSIRGACTPPVIGTPQPGYSPRMSLRTEPRSGVPTLHSYALGPDHHMRHIPTACAADRLTTTLTASQTDPKQTPMLSRLLAPGFASSTAAITTSPPSGLMGSPDGSSTSTGVSTSTGIGPIESDQAMNRKGANRDRDPRASSQRVSAEDLKQRLLKPPIGGVKVFPCIGLKSPLEPGIEASREVFRSSALSSSSSPSRRSKMPELQANVGHMMTGFIPYYDTTQPPLVIERDSSPGSESSIQSTGDSHELYPEDKNGFKVSGDPTLTSTDAEVDGDHGTSTGEQDEDDGIEEEEDEEGLVVIGTCSKQQDQSSSLGTQSPTLTHATEGPQMSHFAEALHRLPHAYVNEEQALAAVVAAAAAASSGEQMYYPSYMSSTTTNTQPGPAAHMADTLASKESTISDLGWRDPSYPTVVIVEEQAPTLQPRRSVRVPRTQSYPGLSGDYVNLPALIDWFRAAVTTHYHHYHPSYHHHPLLARPNGYYLSATGDGWSPPQIPPLTATNEDGANAASTSRDVARVGDQANLAPPPPPPPPPPYRSGIVTAASAGICPQLLPPSHSSIAAGAAAAAGGGVVCHQASIRYTDALSPGTGSFTAATVISTVASAATPCGVGADAVGPACYFLRPHQFNRFPHGELLVGPGDKNTVDLPGAGGGFASKHYWLPFLLHAPSTALAIPSDSPYSAAPWEMTPYMGATYLPTTPVGSMPMAVHNQSIDPTRPNAIPTHYRGPLTGWNMMHLMRTCCYTTTATSVVPPAIVCDSLMGSSKPDSGGATTQLISESSPPQPLFSGYQGPMPMDAQALWHENRHLRSMLCEATARLQYVDELECHLQRLSWLVQSILASHHRQCALDNQLHDCVNHPNPFVPPDASGGVPAPEVLPAVTLGSTAHPTGVLLRPDVTPPAPPNYPAAPRWGALPLTDSHKFHPHCHPPMVPPPPVVGSSVGWNLRPGPTGYEFMYIPADTSGRLGSRARLNTSTVSAWPRTVSLDRATEPRPSDPTDYPLPMHGTVADSERIPYYHHQHHYYYGQPGGPVPRTVRTVLDDYLVDLKPPPPPSAGPAPFRSVQMTRRRLGQAIAPEPTTSQVSPATPHVKRQFSMAASTANRTSRPLGISLITKHQSDEETVKHLTPHTEALPVEVAMTTSCYQLAAASCRVCIADSGILASASENLSGSRVAPPLPRPRDSTTTTYAGLYGTNRSSGQPVETEEMQSASNDHGPNTANPPIASTEPDGSGSYEGVSLPHAMRSILPTQEPQTPVPIQTNADTISPTTMRSPTRYDQENEILVRLPSRCNPTHFGHMDAPSNTTYALQHQQISVPSRFIRFASPPPRMLPSGQQQHFHANLRTTSCSPQQQLPFAPHLNGDHAASPIYPSSADWSSGQGSRIPMTGSHQRLTREPIMTGGGSGGQRVHFAAARLPDIPVSSSLEDPVRYLVHDRQQQPTRNLTLDSIVSPHLLRRRYCND